MIVNFGLFQKIMASQFQLFFQKMFSLGETNLVYCSTGPTDPVFARKKKNNNMDSPIGYFKFIFSLLFLKINRVFYLAQWRRTLKEVSFILQKFLRWRAGFFFICPISGKIFSWFLDLSVCSFFYMFKTSENHQLYCSFSTILQLKWIVQAIMSSKKNI